MKYNSELLRALAEAGPVPMSMEDRAERYAAAAERAKAAGNTEAFTDLIVAAKACGCIERQIAKAERWLPEQTTRLA